MLNAMKQNPSGLAWTLMLTFAIMVMPDFAHASAGGTIANVLCTVVNWFNGPVGKGIATLAIIIIGVGALMGKVSWGMAIIVGVGVAVIFGASEVVNELAGDSGDISGC
jgi:type IV secretion system protein VirB2